MITTVDDFVREFTEIKNMGWIKTHRSGPTGIGKTLEDLLGIVENNADEPDFGDYELKSGRIDSGSMLTLFTKAPQPPKANTRLLEKYGYFSDAYIYIRKVLHSTLSADRFTLIANTGNSLKINCGEEKISIESQNGIEDIYWTRESLQKAFDKKYKNKLVYVKALHRGRGKDEEFRYTEAYEISGFDYDSMMSLLEEGKIKVDIRIGQYADGRTHDHGTGFRILPCDFDKLFRNRVQLV